MALSSSAQLAGLALIRPRPLRARVAAHLATIRGRILLASFCISLVVAALGTYATFGVERAGLLVAKTFDQSLMAINYARAAAADFAGMQAAFARRMGARDVVAQAAFDTQIDALDHALGEDLSIAAARSQSERARAAATTVATAVAEWTRLCRAAVSGQDAAGWAALDAAADTVAQEIDLFINYTAGDGFLYRQKAREAVALDARLNMVGTGLALLISGLIAWQLMRRTIRPVAQASAVAERIARGDLAGDIPTGGSDEFGALLAAMRTMRDNIKQMMDREVASRQSAQARLADALDGSGEGIIVVNADGTIAMVNAQARLIFGLPEPLGPGARYDALADRVAVGARAAALFDPAAASEAPGEVRLADGRWLRISRSAARQDGFVVIVSDITLSKRQEERLTASNLRLDAALDNMSQGLCLYDAQGRLLLANRRFSELFGLHPAAVAPGTSFAAVRRLSLALARPDQAILFERSAGSETGRHASGTRLVELADGRTLAVIDRPTAEGGWVTTYEDLTERLQAEAQAAFLARHDPVTGLGNRQLFTERLMQALISADARLAVLEIDLDHFKHVNDTLGHALGDALLKAVAERLRGAVRDGDIVARLGGDEFAILRQEIGRPEEAALLAREIVDRLRAPFDIEGHRIAVGASIGIALAPEDGPEGGTLLKNADVALYRAKADGRGTWRFFEAGMDARLEARRLLELDLRDALARNEFTLCYQPLYDLRREGVCGFEALLRWRHPTRGAVGPGEFVPVAEEIGLIVPLGTWVLETACAAAVSWPSDIKVAVNVSPAQVKDPGLVAAVKRALAASGLPPHRLELEITETVLLADTPGTIEALHALRGLGVRISMDDFGTGYSSLGYLRSFPFDKIKIDRSFIGDLGAGADAALIVGAITGLGRGLGMRTTAEGVETIEQLRYLQDQDCDEAQGFLFSRPVPAEAVAATIARLGAGTLQA